MSDEEKIKKKVSKSVLADIKNNHYISPHAKSRLKERVKLLYGNTNIKKFIHEYLKSKDKEAIYTKTNRVSLKKNKKSSDYMIFDYDLEKGQWVLVSYVSLAKEIL